MEITYTPLYRTTKPSISLSFLKSKLQSPQLQNQPLRAPAPISIAPKLLSKQKPRRIWKLLSKKNQQSQKTIYSPYDLQTSVQIPPKSPKTIPLQDQQQQISIQQQNPPTLQIRNLLQTGSIQNLPLPSIQIREQQPKVQVPQFVRSGKRQHSNYTLYQRDMERLQESFRPTMERIPIPVSKININDTLDHSSIDNSPWWRSKESFDPTPTTDNRNQRLSFDSFFKVQSENSLSCIKYSNSQTQQFVVEDSREFKAPKRVRVCSTWVAENVNQRQEKQLQQIRRFNKTLTLSKISQKKEFSKVSFTPFNFTIDPSFKSKSLKPQLIAQKPKFNRRVYHSRPLLRPLLN